MNGLKLLTDASVEPISTATAKTHLRVDHTNDDTIIDTFITASRRHVERFLNRALITQTWEAYWDYFPSTEREEWWNGTKDGSLTDFSSYRNFLEIPLPPLQSVTKISTYSSDNTETTFSSSNYYLDLHGSPGRIILNDSAVWPSSLRKHNAVYVKFVCGYGDAGTDVPQDILIGLQMYLSYLYEHRGDQDAEKKLPLSVRTILDPYRVMKTIL
jgi:hypothetical protein